MGNSSGQRLGRLGLRWLALFHRWAGVGLCLLMTLWFATGAVMHFVPFPALSTAERLARSAPIDLSRVRIGPTEALRHGAPASGLRLVDVDGRPVYLVESADEREVLVVGADTGRPLATVSPRSAQQIAARFQGANPARIDGSLAYDQWTVAEEFDPFRPLYRVRFADAAGTELYVSAHTGEVVQRTRASQRVWNWVGANVHWIYFAALRIHGSVWDRLVWWVSLTALSSTVAGVLLGWVRFVSVRRARHRGLTPFRGWLGWHHRIGLFAGTFVLAWILSGWLSMDHGRLFPTGKPTIEQTARLQGRPLISLDESLMPAIRNAAGASEILFGVIAGRGFLVARGGALPTRIIWPDAPEELRMSAIPTPMLLAGVARAWPGRPVEDRGDVPSENLYSMAEGMPAATREFHVGGSEPVDVYVDQESGRIVTVMDSRRKTYEWIYYALHTFRFPGLAARPWLRDVAVLLPLTLGLGFSITGTIIAVMRVRPTRLRVSRRMA